MIVTVKKKKMFSVLLTSSHRGRREPVLRCVSRDLVFNLQVMYKSEPPFGEEHTNADTSNSMVDVR